MDTMRRNKKSEDSIKKKEEIIFEAEISKARNRIGKTIDDITTWFLGFIQSDLNTLSKGDLFNLEYELWCFSIFGPPEGIELKNFVRVAPTWANQTKLRTYLKDTKKTQDIGMNIIKIRSV